MVSASKYDVSITKTLAKELKVGKVGFYAVRGFQNPPDGRGKALGEQHLRGHAVQRKRQGHNRPARDEADRWERMSDEERIEAVRDMQKTAKKQVLTELVRRKEAGEIR